MKILRILLTLCCAVPTFAQKEMLQRAVGTNTVTGSLTSAPFQVSTIAALKAVTVASSATPNGTQVYVTGYYAAGDGAGGYFTYNSASSATDNGGTVIQPTSGSGRWIRSTNGEPYSVDWFGAKGDGSTYDTTTINNCVTAAYAAGVRKVVFSPAKTYALNQRSGQLASIELKPGVSLDGRGCVLYQRGNASVIGHGTAFGTSHTVTCIGTAPGGGGASATADFYVDSTSGFSVGDSVFIRVGPTADPNEPITSFIAKIVGISGLKVTIDRRMEFLITEASLATSAPANKSMVKITTLVSDLTIENFIFDCEPAQGLEICVYLYVAENITIRNLLGRGYCGAGLVYVQHSWFVTINNLTMNRSNDSARRQYRMFGITNSQHVVGTNFFCKEFSDVVGIIEFNCDHVYLTNVQIEDYYSKAGASKVFSVSGTVSNFNQGSGSRVRMKDVVVKSMNNFVLNDSGGTPADVEIENLRVEMSKSAVDDTTALPNLIETGMLKGLFEFQLPFVKYKIDFTRTFPVVLMIPLVDSMSDYHVQLPRGLIVKYELFASASFDATKLTAFFWLGSDLKAQFTAGHRKIYTNLYVDGTVSGALYGTHAARMNPQEAIIYTAGAGVTSLNSFLLVNVTMAKIESFPASYSAIDTNDQTLTDQQALHYYNGTSAYPVIPDTSGATLGQLETQVNTVKQRLRDVGVVKP